MKRIVLPILCVLLLLSACGGSPAVAPSTLASTAPAERVTTAPPPSESSAAPETGTEQTEAGTEPAPESGDSLKVIEAESGESLEYTEADSWEALKYTEEETEAPTPEPVDWIVHTDWSAYQPKLKSKVSYTRLAPGPLDHFEPSEDYGGVYPYVSECLYWGGYRGYDDRVGNRYGLADRTGRILTDGIYDAAYQMGGQIGEDYVHQPFWIVGQQTEVIPHSWSDGEYSGSWYEGEYRYGVISMDGSFALDCEYEDVNGLGQGFYCVDSGDTHSFTVYNEDGSIRFTSDDLLWDTEFDWFRLEYEASCYKLSLSSYGEGAEETVRSRWFDGDGNWILREYYDCGQLHDGLRQASMDGRSYGYVDESGAWVIDPIYTSFEEYQDGCFLLTRIEDGRRVALDSQGRELLTAPEDGWLERAPCGFYVTYYDEDYYDVSGSAYYDREGKLLLEADHRVGCIDADTFYEARGEKTRVFRLSTDQEIILPCDQHFSLFDRCAAPWQGKLSLGYHCTDHEEEKHYFIPSDLSELLPMGSCRDYDDRIFAGRCQNLTDASGEAWFLYWNGRAWQGLNEAGEEITIPIRCPCPDIYDEIICGMTDRDYCFCTRSGEIVFRYPLDSKD